MTDTYSTPQSFRQAVTDRLRQLAKAHRDLQLQDLQRQFAYDRLLCRVFRDAPEDWILKGATAMLGDSGESRATRRISISTALQQLSTKRNEPFAPARPLT